LLFDFVYPNEIYDINIFFILANVYYVKHSCSELLLACLHDQNKIRAI